MVEAKRRLDAVLARRDALVNHEGGRSPVVVDVDDDSHSDLDGGSHHRVNTHTGSGTDTHSGADDDDDFYAKGAGPSTMPHTYREDTERRRSGIRMLRVANRAPPRGSPRRSSRFSRRWPFVKFGKDDEPSGRKGTARSRRGSAEGTRSKCYKC